MKPVWGGGVWRKGTSKQHTSSTRLTETESLFSVNHHRQLILQKPNHFISQSSPSNQLVDDHFISHSSPSNHLKDTESPYKSIITTIESSQRNRITLSIQTITVDQSHRNRMALSVIRQSRLNLQKPNHISKSSPSNHPTETESPYQSIYDRQLVSQKPNHLCPSIIIVESSYRNQINLSVNHFRRIILKLPNYLINQSPPSNHVYRNRITFSAFITVESSYQVLFYP